MLVTDVLNNVDAGLEVECEAGENEKTGPDVDETDDELVKTGLACDRGFAWLPAPIPNFNGAELLGASSPSFLLPPMGLAVLLRGWEIGADAEA